MNKEEMELKLQAKRDQVARYRAREDGSAQIAKSQERIDTYQTEIGKKTEYMTKMRADIEKKIADLEAELRSKREWLEYQSETIDRKIDELKEKTLKEQSKIDELKGKNPDESPVVRKAEKELKQMTDIAQYVETLRSRFQSETDSNMRDVYRDMIKDELAKFKTAKGRGI